MHEEASSVRVKFGGSPSPSRALSGPMLPLVASKYCLQADWAARCWLSYVKLAQGYLLLPSSSLGSRTSSQERFRHWVYL